MRRILICGVPAAGKTTLGNFMEQQFNFRHFDVEGKDAAPFTTLGKLFWTAKIHELMERLGNDRDVVITWGFTPDHNRSLIILRKLNHYGFHFVWLAIDENAAREEYLKRKKKTGKGSVEAFDTQMEKIAELDLESIGPVTVIDALRDGERKTLEDLYSELP